MYTKVTKSSIDELGVCGKQNHIQQINNPHIQHRKKTPTSHARVHNFPPP